jgi:hypothetical protein
VRRAVFASAARVKMAHELGLRFDTDDEDMQVYMGTLACKAALTEAHRLGMPLSTNILNGAAFTGELCTVIWLYTEHQCVFNSGTGAHAAGGGHVNVLSWLKEQGVVFDKNTMNAAALFGKVSTCAYLHAEGCPWNEATSFAAACRKHWDTVRWLREHGCPWYTYRMCYQAAKAGDITAMTYVLQQDPEASSHLSFMLDCACTYGHLVAALWLRQRGVEWPNVLCSWPDHMVVWARAQGCDSPVRIEEEE